MYERLSNFCYFCGHFEHLIRDSAAFELAKIEKGACVRIDYAPWIRVAIDHNKMVGHNASPENDDLDWKPLVQSWLLKGIHMIKMVRDILLILWRKF